MQLQHPFATVTSTVDGDVLEVLCRSEQEYSLATLADLIPNRSPAGIRNATIRLSEQGVVHMRAVGRSRLCTLNRDHLAAAAIVQLAQLRSTFLDRLRTECAAIPSLRYVAMFGSAARGEMRTDSDIDLFFVLGSEVTLESSGPIEDTIHELASRASTWTGNDVRPVIYREDEVQPEQVLNAIASEGVTIAGEHSWLRTQLRRWTA